MLTLYQFPISHYCEKARWALDYKRLEHRTKNLLPGPHVATARRLCGNGNSSVPILVHGEATVQGSAEIITYLDETFRDRPLTPPDPDQRAEALEWEAYADEQIGVHVRRVCYHVLLDHPEIVIPFFAQNGPWYGKWLLKAVFPRLRTKMREFMDINAESSEASHRRLSAALDKVNARLNGRRYLVGGRFTRADLAVAALLAPLTQPPQYGLDWPPDPPPAFTAIIDTYADRIAWTERLYTDHR